MGGGLSKRVDLQYGHCPPKISDFGLSRLIDANHDQYTIVEGTMIPNCRWLPRECLDFGGKFSKSSDIWSFGVTLWEIWNKAEIPYANMSKEQVKQAILAGQNPMSFEIPQGIPEEIVWLLDDIFDLRPSFANIKILLEDLKNGKKGLKIKNYSNINYTLHGIGCSNSETFYSAVSIYEELNSFGEETIIDIPVQNISEIEIVQSEYTLNEENLETILKVAKVNYTVQELDCEDISTTQVPQILGKFKSIETLRFWHKKTIRGCCLLESRSDERKEDGCLFKIEDSNGHPNLKDLKLFCIKVAFPGTFPNLYGLKKLLLDNCDISGDLINDFICHSNLEELILYGITPPLTKEDVEKLLRIKLMKRIGLGRHYREIFNSSFTPIGPDGRLMGKITPNTKIEFKRESCDQTWVQTIESLDIVEATFNLNLGNVDLLNSIMKANSTVVWLTCCNISTRRIQDIRAKFKNICQLDFWHDNMNEDGKCLIYEAPIRHLFPLFERQKVCLLKMVELKVFEKLQTLCLENVEVGFPKSFSVSEYLPNLKNLKIIFCSIIGNFMGALTTPSNLEDLTLWGITPLLKKGDVEKLLRNRSLKYIQLGKHNREIFTSSFTPFGPDGNPMEEIKQNFIIEFIRDSFGQAWVQKSYPVEINEFHLHNRNIQSILNSPIENTNVTKLECNYIQTRSVPEILKKFKSIEYLIFGHILDKGNKCAYFGSLSNVKKEDICLFKMEDLVGYSNLKNLELVNMDVTFPGTFLNLPRLKLLILDYCDISGDFIDFICRSNLEKLGLLGIDPCLTKEDVEKILSVKSLKLIKLGKHFREIFANSFTPIGPDGVPMQEITQNSDFCVSRD